MPLLKRMYAALPAAAFAVAVSRVCLPTPPGEAGRLRVVRGAAAREPRVSRAWGGHYGCVEGLECAAGGCEVVRTAVSLSVS